MLQIKKGIVALSILLLSNLSHAVNTNQLALIHENNEFRVKNGTESHPIQRCYMDKELRGISTEQLAKYATAGAYLKLNKMENSDDYTLRLGGRLNGGGPIMGLVANWTIKVGGYIGVTALCIVHPAHWVEAPHMYSTVSAASEAVGAVASITPGP
jgi:hypothetical protein